MNLRPPVYVLRLGHRKERDKRVTTHVALVARAFGAKGFFLTGDCDEVVIESIRRIESRWGRGFDVVSCLSDWGQLLEYWKKKKWVTTHLTMYGIPALEVIDKLRRIDKPVIVIVGAEKVPREIYELSDFNISITNQPHSEVGALAVFLDRLYNGLKQNIVYRDAKQAVVPSPRGKKIVSLE